MSNNPACFLDLLEFLGADYLDQMLSQQKGGGESCKNGLFRPGLSLQTDLSVASLHVSQCHLWVDGMTAGHTEYLEVCVVAVPLSYLYMSQTGESQRRGSEGGVTGSWRCL